MMTVATTHLSRARAWSWREIVFVVLVALVGLLYLSAARFLLAPWFVVDDPGIQQPEVHRWHFAVTGAATAIGGAGTMLALLFWPRARPLLLQFTAFSVVVGVLLNAPFVGPLMFVVALPIVLVLAAYPAPAALLDIRREGPPVWPLLALSLAAVALLAPTWWQWLGWQIQGVGGEHAAANQWIADLEHTLLLVLGGLAASARRPGWPIMATLGGLSMAYLGLAALLLPDQPGSWGNTGGLLALLGGMLWLMITVLETRRPAVAAGR